MTRQELAPRVADGETCCQAQTPSGTGLDWYCVAASGHDGDHVAWASGVAAHTWPQALPARECPDCRGRASGNVPNIHARHCRHHAITELRNSDRAAAARDYLADYDRLMAAPYDENALTRNHGEMSEALRFLLAEIDRQAGA